MPALDEITQETLDAIAKAQTSGLLSGTGIYGVDLTGLVSLVPVNTRTRNSLPRESSANGALQTSWRALLGINTQQPNPAVGNDFAGPLVSLDEQNVFANYVPLAMAVRVTQDSIDFAKGYADAKAVGTLQGLNQLMIGENKLLLGGQAYALPTCPTPTSVIATTGGTIPASTAIPVKVAARSGYNFYYGGSNVASSASAGSSTSATATNSATVSIPAVKGAFAYDWFVNGFYYTTTTVASVLVTSIPTANAALPNIPNLSTTAVTAVPTVDASFSANSFNGMVAGILGDYGTSAIVTPGSGTASGATFIDNGAATLTLVGGSISQIDSLLLGIWNTVELSPQRLVMGAAIGQEISQLLFGTSAAFQMLEPGDRTSKANAVAGSFAAHYINRASGGDIVDFLVDPHMPPGMVIARTDKVPFPGANIDSVFSVRTLRDYSSFDYGANYNPGSAGGGPRSDTEVRSIETLVNRAPSTCGVLANCA